MSQIFVVASRPWDEEKQKYGEWRNEAAYASSGEAASAIRVAAQNNEYLDYLPVEYEIQMLELFDRDRGEGLDRIGGRR